MSDLHWTDWLTAISTAATVVVTGATGFLGYVVLRRDAAKEAPYAELEVAWNSDVNLGSFLKLRVGFINRSYENITISSCRVLQPVGTKLSAGSGKGYGGSKNPARGEADVVDLGYDIYPPGSNDFMGRPGGDRLYMTLYAFPPAEWSEGKLRICLDTMTKSETIRRRRLTIIRTISADIKPQAADTVIS